MTGGTLVRINDLKKKSPSEKAVGDLMEALNGWGLEFFRKISLNLKRSSKVTWRKKGKRLSHVMLLFHHRVGSIESYIGMGSELIV